MMVKGIDGVSFKDLVDSLLVGSGIPADPYMNLADFDSYKNTQKIVGEIYKNPLEWNKKSLNNIAGAGIFSADRAIRQYANDIWGIKPIV